MLRIEARLICEGRTEFGPCRDYFSHESLHSFSRFDVSMMRRYAAKAGWTKAKNGTHDYDDFCPACSARRKTEQPAKGRIGK